MEIFRGPTGRPGSGTRIFRDAGITLRGTVDGLARSKRIGIRTRGCWWLSIGNVPKMVSLMAGEHTGADTHSHDSCASEEAGPDFSANTHRASPANVISGPLRTCGRCQSLKLNVPCQLANLLASGVNESFGCVPGIGKGGCD